MTTEQLTNKVTVSGAASNYRVVIEYRGNIYYCRSNNAVAMDRLNQQSYLNEKMHGAGDLTLRQALEQFYNECKQKNNLR